MVVSAKLPHRVILSLLVAGFGMTIHWSVIGATRLCVKTPFMLREPQHEVVELTRIRVLNRSP